MTRDEAVAEIKTQLGFRTDQDANIVTKLQQAQARLERRAVKPWFLLSEVMSIYTSPDEHRVQLPTGFLGEYEHSELTYYPDDTSYDPVQLVKEDKDKLDAYYKLTTGTPEQYSLDGLYFRIYPKPDDLYTLKHQFYIKDTVLTSNIENNWLLHVPDLLMGFAGVLIAGPLRDKEAMKVFSEWRSDGLIELYRQNEARKHENRSYQIGGPH